MTKTSSVFLLGRRVKASYGNHLFEGVVVGETKNTVIISTDHGEKVIPKIQSVFWVGNGKEVKIEGFRLFGRPFERLLKGVRP
ncbi:MAG: ribonuclease P protein subunit [Candidatus Caldarchaeum sp.]|nr:ribonuclease P protein subunit [Candidatus Caldarchaeum sp.]MDW8435876.1 ribonuclease P protein subunit [Candidatus Caldarchaeum sp.]